MADQEIRKTLRSIFEYLNIDIESSNDATVITYMEWLLKGQVPSYDEVTRLQAENLALTNGAEARDITLAIVQAELSEAQVEVERLKTSNRNYAEAHDDLLFRASAIDGIIELAGEEDPAELIRKAKQLPMTADKVRVTLGMELWLPIDCKYPGEVDGLLNDGLLLMNECIDWPDRAGAEEPTYKSTWLYSTPEAAQEAADAGADEAAQADLPDNIHSPGDA